MLVKTFFSSNELNFGRIFMAIGKSNQTIDEIIDAAKSQDAVTVAPHPFSLIDALRNDSSKCDLFEVFNSSNIDIYSNKKAEIFAKENNLLTLAGSDSHVASTIGRCTNLIDSENNLDDILYSCLLYTSPSPRDRG